MLHIIEGRSGYGKTRYIWQNIFNQNILGTVSSEKNIIMLVPEQFSFEAEKLFCEIQKNKKATNIEVLSFKRLANLVFRQYGGLVKKTLSNIKNNIIINQVLSDLKKDLKVYSKQISNIGFSSDILSIISVFANNNICADDIDECATFLKNELLVSKLEDISLIYRSYKKCIDQEYTDESDILNIALKKIRENNFFEGKTVYIDNFTAFTKSELNIVEEMIKQCEDVYISLCADDLSSEYGMLKNIIKTKTAMLLLAGQHNVYVSENIILKTPYRFKSSTLALLERCIFDLFSGVSCETKCLYERKFDDSVIITECQTIKQEIKYVASKISCLIKEEGYRYSDISIVLRDIDPYEPYIDNIFKDYDIPYFLDEKALIKDKILSIFVLSILEASKGNLKTIDILKILKTNLIPVDSNYLSKLEIYCNIWDINGDLWLEDFKFHPRGSLKEFSEEDYLELDNINEVRRQIVDILLDFKEKTSGKKTASEFIKVIYNLLIDLKVDERLGEISKNDFGKNFLLDENEKTWDCLIDIFDDIADVLNDKEISISEFICILKNSVDIAEISLLSSAIDQVKIGEADHMINSDSKVVFVIGLGLGLFPRNFSKMPFFSVRENKILAENGLDIYKNKIDQSINERYYVYKAITSASEKVFLSFYSSGLDGEKIYRSLFLSQLIKLGVKTKIFDETDQNIIQNKKTAYSYLCQNFNNPDIKSQLKEIFVDDPDFLKKIDRLDFIKTKDPQIFNISDKQKIKNHIGRKLSLSPSSIERFFSCKFKFFCSDILGVRNIQKVDLTKLQQGNIIHHALKELLEKKLYLKYDDIKKNAKSIIDEYISSLISNKTIYNHKNNYIHNEIIESVYEITKHISLEQESSNFKPMAFELDISDKSKTKPLKITLSTGEEVIVSGKVDRVDLYNDGNSYFIRVIDYKSGKKDFSLDDVYHGMNMQMLLYLFIIINSYNNTHESKKLKPAGVLYLPAGSKTVLVDRDIDEEKKQKINLSKFKMNGLLIDDVDVLLAMEKDLKGNFIPANLNKDNTISKKSSTLSKGAFSFLETHIKNIITSMASDIFDGKIEAIPIESNRYKEICNYCDYKYICNLGEDKIRSILSAPKLDWYLENENDNSII